MSPEEKVVAATKKYLKALPFCEFRKVHGGIHSASEPDLDIVYKSISIKAEAKSAKGKATSRQVARIREWRKAGAVAFVFREAGEVRRVIEMIDTIIPHTPALEVDYGDEIVAAISLAGAENGEVSEEG